MSYLLCSDPFPETWTIEKLETIGNNPMTETRNLP